MAVALALLALALAAACSGVVRGDGLDATKLPDDVRADYDVFAQRCSKCHSLARPLQSGIDDDAFWALYVARMRRQPGSGISQEDTVRILRFLHFYAEEQRAKRSPAAPPAPSAPPASPAADGGA
jgi:hypothetical protein